MTNLILAGLILFASVYANALSMSGGGGGCTTDCTFTSVTTNGTAPSLTATGAVFTGSGTFAGTNGLSVGGNLGIGTASPSTKLHVIGTATVAQVSAVSGGGPGLVLEGYGFASGEYPGSGAAQFGGGATYNGRISFNRDTQKMLYDNLGTVAFDAGPHVFRIIRDGTPVEAVSIVTNGGLKLYSRTIAQLLAITPTAGEAFYCSNCSPAKIVVSTGTSAGNFADAIGGAFQ